MINPWIKGDEHTSFLRVGTNYNFRVGATFEMIELNTEKCIFQLIKITAAQRLLSGRERGKVAERQRERVCACECWSKPQIASISIHKQHG